MSLPASSSFSHAPVTSESPSAVLSEPAGSSESFSLGHFSVKEISKIYISGVDKVHI